MIRLHHAHETRSVRPLWLLYELGVEFELAVHAFGKNLRSPEYKALHPVGRVPALEIDGTSMIETGAMAEYLTETYPDAGLGRAPGHPERRDFLVWLHFAESVSQHTANLTQQHIVIYPPEKRSTLVQKLEAARLATNFEAINQRLKGRDYLLDGGFSAADIGVGQAVDMGRRFVALDDFPALNDWFDRITARPAYQKCLPPVGAERLYHQDFYPIPEEA